MDPPPERYLEPMERFWGLKKKAKPKVRNCHSHEYKFLKEYDALQLFLCIDGRRICWN